MSIIRKDLSNPYFLVDKKIIDNKQISLAALGVFVFISFNDKKNFSILEISEIYKESIEDIESYVNELKSFGYVEVNHE